MAPDDAIQQFLAASLDPRVELLVAANDWNGLFRLGFARQYKPATRAAIAVARQVDPRIADLLERTEANPFDLPVDLSWIESIAGRDGLILKWRTQIYAAFLLCELAAQMPVEQRVQLFEHGIAAAQATAMTANVLDDPELLALAERMRARALQELRRWDESLQAYSAAMSHDKRASETDESAAIALGMTLNNRGTLLQDLGRRDEALRDYDEALALRRKLASRHPDAFEPDVAGTLNNRGALLQDLGRRDEALRDYDEALALRRKLASRHPDAFEPDVAMTLNNRGNLLGDLGRRDEALRDYDEALALRRKLASRHPDAFEPDVAGTLNNRGNLLGDLGRRDEALRDYDEALPLRRKLASRHPDAFEPDVAMTLNNRGNLLGDLGRRDEALRDYDEALPLYRKLASRHPDAFEPNVAGTLNNRGTLLKNLGRRDEALRDYDEALALYRKLASRHPDAFEPDVAMTLNNRGALLKNLGRRDEALPDYDEALPLYRKLASRHPDAFEPNVSGTLNNRGTLLQDLGRQDEALRDYDEAIQLQSKAIIERLGLFLPVRIRSYLNRGQLHAAIESTRQSAQDDFQKAIDLIERYRAQHQDEGFRQYASREFATAYDRQVDVSTALFNETNNTTHLAIAFDAAEASRGRVLLEMMAGLDLSPPGCDPELVAKFRNDYRTMKEAAREASAWYARRTEYPDHFAAAERTARATRTTFQATLDRVHTVAPGFDPDCPVPPVHASELPGWLPTDRPTAIVQFKTLADRGVAIVVFRDGPRLVELPELTSKVMGDVTRKWLSAYGMLRGRQIGFDVWSRGLPGILEPYASALAPLWPTLAGFDRLILSPELWMNLIPLHALSIDGGRTVAERFETVYVPSLSVVKQTTVKLDRKSRGSKLLSAVNPTYDLSGAASERYVIGASPDDHRAYGFDVKRDWLLHHSADRHLWHYSGHAMNDFANPLESRLQLSQHHDRCLKLRDILTELNLSETWLADLSGCETNLFDLEKAHDPIGLSTGFLYAGAACVLASLWSVEDVSTALLKKHFYDRWKPGMGVADALRASQLWLRDLPGSAVMEELEPLLAEMAKDRQHRADVAMLREAARQYGEVSRPFAGIGYWAPFTANGIGWATGFPEAYP